MGWLNWQDDEIDDGSSSGTVDVGDITAGRKLAYLGRVNFISNSRVLKPKKTDKALRPEIRFRFVAINRHLYINLYCKLGIS